MLIDVRTSGKWSGGGGAVQRLFRAASEAHPDVLAIDSGHGVPLYLRNVVPMRAMSRPFLLLPQNAWPWTPWHGRGRVALRWGALRVASWVVMRRAIGIVRLSSVIPDQPNKAASAPIVPNVLDDGFDEALHSCTPAPGWVAHARGAFLSVGSLTPYRNLPRLLQAHATYWQQGGRRRLVVVGPAIAPYLEAEARARIQALQADERTSLVPSRQARCHILQAMQQCAGVVLPSLAEASPLTLLEALACGAPVAASRIPGHLETTGRHRDSVAWMNPASTGSMATTLQTLDKTSPPIRPHQDAAWRAAERMRWADRMVATLTTLVAHHRRGPTTQQPSLS